MIRMHFILVVFGLWSASSKLGILGNQQGSSNQRSTRCTLQNSFTPYLTIGWNEGVRFEQGPALLPTSDVESVLIDMYTSDTYQQVQGFGAAVSNSAAYVINNTPHRTDILQQLFDITSGAGISYLRLVMGGSDFQAVSPYTYCDLPSGQTDFELNCFSIGADQDFVIPVLKDILNINPDIRIMGSPWSAPAWMKTEDSLNGGSLRNEPEYMQTYANYFVRFVRAYADQGITIHAITVQNEPEHASGSYPTMFMSQEQQREFVRDYLGPIFRDEGISTSIVIWDHNWDRIDYPLSILSDPQAKEFVTGTAFHCYAGDPLDVKLVQEAHPDKDIFFTECSGGEWSPNFDTNLYWNGRNIFISQLHQYSRNVLFWNLALDENHGPKVDVGGCMDCRGVLTVESNGSSYNKEVEYYGLLHFAKFIRPGAVRIGTTNDFRDDIEFYNVAFQNPDGSVVLVVLNGWGGGRVPFSFQISGNTYTYRETDVGSMVTFVQDCE